MAKRARPASLADATRAEVDWLFSQNLAVFSGEWVAVLNRGILSHGRDLKRVHAEAIERSPTDGGGQAPLCYCVPSGFSGGA
jgi:hypothetical protein